MSDHEQQHSTGRIALRRFALAALVLYSCSITVELHAAAVVVKNLRLWRAPDHTRVVFDLSDKVQHRVLVLSNPDRLVVDLDDATAAGAFANNNYEGPFLRKVRLGNPEPRVLRIVLDLKQPISPRSFVLQPNDVYGHRLVVDLYAKTATQKKVVAAAAPENRPYRVVAIDAGHGGEDPGAVGRKYRTREKDVTLQVANELKSLLDRDKMLRPVMVRRGDYYISLRGRTKIARREQADVFVSIHADAFPKQASVRGSSVYALSRRGASSEGARWLADKENAADLIGGVSLRDKDDVLAKVLLDLSMTKTNSESVVMGGYVLTELGRVGKLHRTKVEQAGFAVLKSPDMPSILIETAFLSNPTEEKLLRTRSHRQKLAQAIYRGIKRYLKQKPMEFRSPVPAVHIVRKGDSLSEIALRYRVGMASIKRANNMKTDTIRIGQKLKIPTS